MRKCDVKHGVYVIVAQRVVFDFAFLTDVDDGVFAQHGKLVRNGGMFHAEKPCEVAHAKLVNQKRVHYFQTGGVCDDFQKDGHSFKRLRVLHVRCDLIHDFRMYGAKMIAHVFSFTERLRRRIALYESAFI